GRRGCVRAWRGLQESHIEHTDALPCGLLRRGWDEARFVSDREFTLMPGQMERRRWSRLTSPLTQYAFAVASVSLIALLRAALHPSLGVRSQHVLFLPAVLVATFYGGAGPGLLALVLSLVLSFYAS